MSDKAPPRCFCLEIDPRRVTKFQPSPLPVADSRSPLEHRCRHQPRTTARAALLSRRPLLGVLDACDRSPHPRHPKETSKSSHIRSSIVKSSFGAVWCTATDLIPPKSQLTYYVVVRRSQGQDGIASRVEVQLYTGRTLVSHRVRVSLIGYLIFVRKVATMLLAP